MEFTFWGLTIALPPLHITIFATIIIILLIRWSRQLETRRFTVFFYFLISLFIASIYSHQTDHGVFELWIPLGFIVVLLYLSQNPRYHPAKMKASMLGLTVAVYQIVLQYT